jgi:magnesium transporter
MLHATEILGAEAYDSQGNFVGRVKELFLEPADQPNRISKVLLGRGRFRALVARYDQVKFVAPAVLKLNTDETHLEPYQANEAWLALGKDLLDQQIIDTGGRKVVRVNDIDLGETAVNSHVEMRVMQVDIGLKGAARRLFQGLMPPGAIRRIQSKLPSRVIPWEFVNLIEPDPMRRVKLRLSHHKLARLHPADLADIMEELSPAERDSIISSLDEQTAAEALAELDGRLKAQIVEKLDPDKAADILEEMDPDEAADVLASLPPETSHGLLQEMTHKDASEMRALMLFDENTAGGMMNTDIVVVGEDATLSEVVDHIRYQEIDPDQLDNIILLDQEAHYTGVVPISRLALAQPGEKMANLRAQITSTVFPDAEEKDVFELFDKYNLRSLVVLDKENHPIGAITVDDVISRMHAKL